jgi:putative ABC transport system permease protein
MRLPLNLRIALSSLAAHKLRAVLAMLGVFLGALAFTGVQNISQMMVRQAEIETEKLGPNLYAVVAGKVRFRRSGGARISTYHRNFTVSDVRALMAGVPSLMDATPFIVNAMPVRGGGEATTARVTAAWENFSQIRSFGPDIGRFFTAEEVQDADKVVVLGRKIAKRLFRSPEAAMGEMVFIFRAGFRVIGIMEAKGRDISGDDQDEILLMPLTTYMRRASNQDWVDGAFITLADSADRQVVDGAVESILRKRHRIGPGEEDDFDTLTARDTIQLQQQALDLMQTLGGIASGVSFAVGGLGILSIMVLVVRSRRVEIGIRRAVGGKQGDIVRQFLFEAAVMSGVGGSAGVLVSVGAAALVARFGDFPFIADPFVVSGTLVSSFLLGIAAGAYPAWQAARIQILDVLK